MKKSICGILMLGVCGGAFADESKPCDYGVFTMIQCSVKNVVRGAGLTLQGIGTIGESVGESVVSNFAMPVASLTYSVKAVKENNKTCEQRYNKEYCVFDSGNKNQKFPQADLSSRTTQDGI